MQAAALGIKPAVAVTKPAAPKAATTKPAVKPAASSVAKPVVKTAAKPAAKPAIKAAPQAKPKPSNGKKDDHKNNHNKNDKKDDKKAKPEKVKMERDSFTMPKDEYAQLTLLKARLTSMGQPAKKSELLRAGIKLLAAMSDNTLKTTLAKVPVIKTGRPNK